jgi:hypothetical protein
MRSDPQIQADVHKLNADEFVQKYAHPFLAFAVEEGEEDAEFRTIVAQGTDGFGPQLHSIVPVVKRLGANEFSFISVGRTPNNDIVIDVNSVSKCHAFIQARGKTYTIADAGSRNGTQVNGVLVQRHSAVELRSGDVLVLSGKVSATFLDPRTAHAWLRHGGRPPARRP